MYNCWCSDLVYVACMLHVHDLPCAFQYIFLSLQHTGEHLLNDGWNPAAAVCVCVCARHL